MFELKVLMTHVASYIATVAIAFCNVKLCLHCKIYLLKQQSVIITKCCINKCYVLKE